MKIQKRKLRTLTAATRRMPTMTITISTLSMLIKKTMETFFEFSNKLLENKDLIKEHNSKFYKDKKKYKNLSNKIDAFQEKLNENLKK